MKHGIILFISIHINSILIILTVFAGCTKEITDPTSTTQIKEVSIPSEINVVAHGKITLSGKGFKIDDKIKLESVVDASRSFIADIDFINEQSLSFTLPNGVISETYNIILIRSEKDLLLGSTKINITVETEIPDLPGMTVKGIVHSNGTGIAGVVVSDGYEVTITDRNGIYYLPSAKKNGYVFISIPGNYEVNNDGNLPMFFKRLYGGSSVERKDFGLIPADNRKHIIVAAADWHLANRNDDLSQFSRGFIPDVNATIKEYSDAGTKVYGIPLGDMTWDAYWYSNNFFLTHYIAEMNRVKCSMFNVMGNHDNDPYIQGDSEAEEAYKQIIGPTYYSFNLGDIHYIVLDNIQYINNGAYPGVTGSRNYNDVITSNQIEWLKKDLATITDKDTPIVVAMHAPLFNNPGLDNNNEQLASIALNNGNSFLSALQGFSQVYIITGHTHMNYSVAYSGSVIEQNTGAVCATWWWTGRSGYAGNHICKDGTPGGYGVWEIDGKDVKWYYKSIGKPKNYQFRTYDLNNVHITTGQYAPNAADDALAPYAGAYSAPNQNNEVLINVWGYGPGWIIEVKEGGLVLPVERVSALDPLHIISYEAQRINAGAVPTSSFVTAQTAHMFLVTASDAASTLQITVTDRFGNVYTETMLRPKTFNYSMN